MRPFRKKKKPAKPPIQYVKLNLVSMDVEAARQSWVLFHTGSKLYYSAMALSCVAALDLATIYGSKRGAEEARDRLVVSISASLEPRNLMDHVAMLLGRPAPDAPEADTKPQGWEDLGIEKP